MKRIICLLFIFFAMFVSASCNGNFSQIDLNNPVSVPENGIVEKSVLEKVKKDGSVSTFVGESNGIEYRWIIFGRDITKARDVNLSVEVEAKEKIVSLRFSETEDYGFTALLSVYLNEKWGTEGVTVYCDGEKTGTVSVTGSKTSILNLSVDRVINKCEIIYELRREETESSFESEISETSFDELSKDGMEKSEEMTSVPHEEISSSEYEETSSRPVSDGKDEDKDKYETDPVPEGKPLPVEPEDQDVDENKTYTCTFSIECSTILNNLPELDPDKLELIPANGVILAPTEVTFCQGESVFDVLKRVCKENNIHLEFSWTPIYNSAYIEGIHNLYEFDCGSLSGWMYCVNGWYPNYGCSRYQLADGETVEWRFTCDLGRDVGEERLGQS